MADLCVGELTKLRAKIRARNPFLLIFRKRDVAEEEEEKESRESSSSSTPSITPKSAARQDSMSETTVFLLMDRFAPS
ncbi:hypothetical protein ACS0TY_001827 [Phlomoides rotata]